MTTPPSIDRSAAVRWLMADLIQWHQRENKPDWWAHFRRLYALDDRDFIEDADCLGGLHLIGEVDRVKRSIVWRYEFPADQDHKFKVGDVVYDPHRSREPSGSTGKQVLHSAGTIVAIDEAAGTIDLQRGSRNEGSHPTALIPGKPYGTTQLEVALQRIAKELLADPGGLGDGQYLAVRRLLHRVPPALAGERSLESVIESLGASQAFIESAALLDRSPLIVQGPPGAGKTWALARAVIACAAAGQSVGLCAFKHESIKAMIGAIREALTDPTVARMLADGGVALRIMRKIGDAESVEEDESGFVTETESNPAIAAAIENRSHSIIAGTAWLFAREQLAERLDVLFIDEAGQISLATACAAATAARNVVLVGDPQQLAQPGKVIHPPLPSPAIDAHPFGAGASALSHVLAGRATIPASEGIFLDQTQRLHPEICEFISISMYDGRLVSADHCARRVIIDADGHQQAGIRWHPVEHVGNKLNSVEEVDAIRAIVRGFEGATRVAKDGTVVPLAPGDVMVVAPYNSQVNDLRAALPDCRVGTVDKYQGLEAPIVIVSLTASSSDDVPRGLEFLLSTNRLNVAVSRAQSLCIIVGSPSLLATRCNSVHQLELVNVLCRYVEMAEVL
jgi:uncharacterized protein